VGRGRDLEAERVVIVPIGGAHAIGRLLTRLGPLGTRVRLRYARLLVEAAVGRDTLPRPLDGLLTAV